MSTEMSDDAFLDYCETHSHTQRCGFVTAHVARLCRLAGYESADKWAAQPHAIHDLDPYGVRDAVKAARERLRDAAPPTTQAEG